MGDTVRSHSVSAARQRFFAGGAVPEGLISPPILRSWTRCVALGLDSGSRPQVEPVTSYELRQIRERNEALLRRCRPEIEALHADAKATDSIVILTDSNGLVLDRIGSTGFADRAAQVALIPGVPWSEAATGTNAIGTALAERRPVEVRGSEHYFEPHRILSCFASPILGPTGELVGVLDLSGHASMHHAHALGLVRLAVDQIEHRLFEQGFERCDILRVHTDPALLGTAREGVLVFEDQRLVAANRHGLTLLDLDWEAIGTRTWRDLFPGGLPGAAEGARLPTSARGYVHARLQRPVSRPRRSSGGAEGAQHLAPVLDERTTTAIARAARLVDAGVPVLVRGETGTGKEVFARAVHVRSARGAKPFVAVNCAALPESLIESELFGYEEGAFTGARRHGSKGLLREADGGSLFLDEIGDMPLPLQARLLRVLQEREVVPLGGGRAVPVDFNLMCATHQDLSKLVGEGRFRSDLYFRIAQYTFELAPIRAREHRRELICQLWDRLGGNSRGMSLSPECERLLSTYDWPGNFRQLVGTLRALIALGEPGQILLADALPPDIRAVEAGCAPPSPRIRAEDSKDGLAAITREAMREALRLCEGNVSQAARRLGISRSTLYRRLLSGA